MFFYLPFLVFHVCKFNVTYTKNVETLKENGNLFSQFAQNVVEANFLRSRAGGDYLLGNCFKIKFPKTWLYFI